jgi:hypothetical protein
LSWPTIIANNASPTLTAGNSIFINGVLVTSSGTTATSFAININDAGIPGVHARVVNNKLEIYADSNAENDGSTAGNNGIVSIENNTGTLLTALGITARVYYAPTLQQSPNFTVPRWRLSDTQPHPTGSVWNKINAVNQGADFAVKKYNSSLGLFVQQNCLLYENDETANKNLDPAGGGRNITAGATYAQYDVNNNDTMTFKLYERRSSGNTIVTGNDTNPEFTNNNQFTISASARNSTTLTTPPIAPLP